VGTRYWPDCAVCTKVEAPGVGAPRAVELTPGGRRSWAALAFRSRR
jgi:hypothetical protein